MDEQTIITAAIDFGTTYSGYAFSTMDDNKKDPLNIFAMHWTHGMGQLVTLKTSTCVLFKPDRSLHSCGFEAEEKYGTLAFEGNHREWYFFRRFKMLLYDKMSIKRDVSLEDESGKSMLAMNVFSGMIGYLKDHMMKECNNHYTGILETDIKWVITVPAIWNDSAKQFMREAATQAGIPGHLLVIALEPEAASLFCKHLPLEKLEGGYDVFHPGAKYLVLDCGGGTVDITVHEVLKDKNLKELYKANGGDWGGINVDKAFYDLLEKLVGKNVLEEFIKEHKYDDLDLLNTFEVKKKTINPCLGGKILFKVPIALNEIFKKSTGKDIKDTLDFRDQISWQGDKLLMEASVALSLFDTSCDAIKKHLTTLFQDDKLKDLHAIIMVGGLSESKMIQAVVKDLTKDSSIKVVVPNEASTAVLKGAVLFGYNPKVLRYRICRYTYGISCLLPWEGNNDKPEYKIRSGTGKYVCSYRFQPYVMAGEEIEIGGKQYTGTLFPLRADQTSMKVPIYVSKCGVSRYVLDCIEIGTLLFDMPDISRGMDRMYEVRMEFAHTESSVTVTDQNTKRSVSAKFDFLG